MKKRLFTYTTLFIVLLACSDDFTEIAPVGALADEALANETGVDLLLTGAYSALDGIRNNQGAPDWAVSGDNWWFDVISDDAHKGSTDGDQPDLFALEIFDWATANPYIFGKWNGLYAGVNRANAVISLINSSEEGDLTAKLAEARFLRGHFNFELQKIYGNPAYISDENYAATEFNQPNPGPIWEQIEADFQFAIDNLPASQDDDGRPDSWTAKAFLGKAHLFQADWAPALALLKDVIDNGPYALNTEFVDNFNAAGENGPESVFAIQFAADDGQSFNGNRGGTLNFPGGGPFNPETCCGFYQPTQDLANAYKTDGSGLPLLDTFNQSDIANDAGVDTNDTAYDADTKTYDPSLDPFVTEQGPLDPRLDYTVGRRKIDYNGFGAHPGKIWIRATFGDISGPYLPKKNVYQAGELGNNQGTGAWGEQRSGINYNIMRFADVLLMAAEAAVETNDLVLALDYVNRVRNRAKNMTYVQARGAEDEVIEGTPAADYQIEPYASFASQDFARKAVRFERRLELGMEGHRLFDLRRWGVALETINTYAENEARTIPNFGDKFRAYEPKHDLLPLPLNAIDLSGGILNQNDGF
ncbi:RagB/SusD family nutrient uptake outer membrane protein [Ulvibacterium marinum]|uniref:RagB/SusD family nutrient uptake outer membrane protein n=1 Tax=Ulvibacterium marinum TaxID=2419782 RepID=A0A3B0C0T4_9FLAO|nr:RagB/SusD family nutrient uptake outer membrane protein [Ulvibacterium marinum]RKN79263.1 RagB/SusD family nutrient uptake outer membrane protein [Ulvibacterium marinum]